MSLGLLCYSPPLVSILSFPTPSFNPEHKCMETPNWPSEPKINRLGAYFFLVGPATSKYALWG
jgi:hypothetical protein